MEMKSVGHINACRVIKIRFLTKSTYSLVLERNNFEFIPGQCVNLGLVGSGINREYSSYSSVHDKKKLEFLIKIVEGGAVSTALSKLSKGDLVQIDGAYGKFILRDPHDLEKKRIFVGTGTGIAPFHSFAVSYPKLNYQVIHGIRSRDEEYDVNDYGNRYIGCTSRDKTGDFVGRVTDYLKSKPIDLTADYYLCGNSDMINDVYDILSGAGVNGSQIFTESFF